MTNVVRNGGDDGDRIGEMVEMAMMVVGVVTGIVVKVLVM